VVRVEGGSYSVIKGGTPHLVMP